MHQRKGKNILENARKAGLFKKALSRLSVDTAYLLLMHATWELLLSVTKCGFTNEEPSIEVTLLSCGKSTHNGMTWKPLFMTNEAFSPPLKRSALLSS